MKNNQRKIAIVTYNTVGDGQYSNGWVESKENRVYISQLSRDKCIEHNGRYGAAPSSIEGKGKRKNLRKNAANSVIDNASNASERFDLAYVYVGANGGEQAIMRAKELNASETVYVMCDCNQTLKKDLIGKFGSQNHSIMWAECGGHRTLEKILNGLKGRSMREE